MIPRPLDALVLTGSPRERGLAQARLSGADPAAVRAVAESRFAAGRAVLESPAARTYLDGQAGFARAVAAPEWAELEGVAEGFGLDPAVVFALMHLSILSGRFETDRLHRLGTAAATWWRRARRRPRPVRSGTRPSRRSSSRRPRLRRRPHPRRRHAGRAGCLFQRHQRRHLRPRRHRHRRAAPRHRLAALPLDDPHRRDLPDRRRGLCDDRRGSPRRWRQPDPRRCRRRGGGGRTPRRRRPHRPAAARLPQQPLPRRADRGDRGADLAVGARLHHRAAGRRRPGGLDRGLGLDGIEAVAAAIARGGGDVQGFCRHGEGDGAHTVSTSIYTTADRSLRFSRGRPCDSLWEAGTILRPAAEAAP